MVVHQRGCDGKVQFDYVGGSFRNHDTVWDTVVNAGVEVEDATRCDEFFIVVDGENVLKEIEEEEDREMEWTPVDEDGDEVEEEFVVDEEEGSLLLEDDNEFEDPMHHAFLVRLVIWNETLRRKKKRGRVGGVGGKVSFGRRTVCEDKKESRFFFQ